MFTRMRMWSACGFVGLWVICISLAGCNAPKAVGASEQAFPIADYAQARSRTERRLSEVSTLMTTRLNAPTPEAGVEAMQDIAAFLREHIAPHAAEVNTLYEFADRLAGPRYTETMRYEHREIESRIRFLDSLASADPPDLPMFRSKLHSLLSYMWGHMDTETNTIGVLVVEHEVDRQHQVESQVTSAARRRG